MLATELTLARSGAIDADLSGAQPFYGTDFTKPLLFLEDGAYYANQATAEHLTGDQWGVMNETGSYPGQPWLWLYQMWYHVPGWRNSANIDLIAIYMTGVATLLLLAIPFIPGLRDIPRWIPVHRLIWRNWDQSRAFPRARRRDRTWPQAGACRAEMTHKNDRVLAVAELARVEGEGAMYIRASGKRDRGTGTVLHRVARLTWPRGERLRRS